MVSSVKGLASTLHSKCAGSPSPTSTVLVMSVILKITKLCDYIGVYPVICEMRVHLNKII